MNPALRTTFDWLREQGLPPLPVAPAQDPTRYPARNRDGSLKRDKDGTLVPAFTGKNPSYVDSSGIPHLIRHTQYQNRMPTQAELQTWFSHPANGIGTLGGWHNIVWVDVDVKQFESQQTCDQRITDWLGQYPLLQQTFTERTHSGGRRLAVRVHEKSFTNFSLDGVGGHHMGEALGQGLFTVLAPTVGPSGKAYINVQRVPPIWVGRLDAIGLYPVSGRREQGQSRQSRPHIQAQPPQPGVLRLEDLATAKAQAVLHGDSPLESRSHSLTYALREFYGWENWASQNRVPISGNAEELARAAGAALGIDADRTERIIQSLPDPACCIPAVVFTGGEISAWRRLGKLSQEAYRVFCPAEVQKEIKVQTAIFLNQVRQSFLQSRVSQSLAVSPFNKEKMVVVPQESCLSTLQERDFTRYAWAILKKMGQVKIDDQTAKTGRSSYLVQGRVYRLEAYGQHLTVATQDRGVIFAVKNEDIQFSKLTLSDHKTFQAVSNRVYQQPAASRTALSCSQDLE